MESHLMQSPTDRNGPRVREDESTLESDEARNPSPLDSQSTLLASGAPTNTDEENGNCEKTPRPRHSRWRVIPWDNSFWTVYQKKPWSMYLFLIAGTLFAVGHHLFYWRLDNKEAKHQSLMLRYGTILAFCSKASLGAAVMLARRQRIWMVVRQRVVRLRTIDSIFTAAEDITALFDWKAIKKAKVATCMAIYIWVTPLIVVLTSETLSIVSGTKEETALCPEARTLNFSHEAALDWREGIRIDDINANSLSEWNTTMSPPEAGDPDSFDYWTDVSLMGKILVQRVLYLQQAVARENAAREVCTANWNCSYVVDFVGPGYKCEEVASGIGSKTKKLGKAEPPFGTEDIVPEGKYTYLALIDEGEYNTHQLDSGPGGIPLIPPPFPRLLGAFKVEPIIWIGYSTVDDYSKLQPANRSMEGWDDAYTPKIMGCEHYEVKYKVQFNYTNGEQSYKIKDRKFIGKLIDTTFIRGKKDASDGTWDNSTASPTSNFILARDVQNYRRIAAYHSLGKEFRSFLNGTIGLPGYLVNTDILKTSILTLPNFLPKRNLQQEIPKMYEDIVISLLSNPTFVVVSWANDDSIVTGRGLGGDSTNYTCIRSRPTTFFDYNKAQLCIIYSLSIAIAAVGVLLGLQAAHQEGVMHDVKPSSIIKAARPHSLTEEQCGDQDIKDLKVGFGWERDVAQYDTLERVTIEVGVIIEEFQSAIRDSDAGGPEVDKGAKQARLNGPSGVPDYVIQDSFQLHGSNVPASFVRIFEKVKANETQ
ncbi:hypothetical protein B0T10DRAFT_567301 [Thelonectria olida]|uniref:Uncharacterized protein n=1 Tax=Thelonectria olida TaxID=1576542 RepID=A0A9P8VVE4_9HYPO|nr:hypothetical protein B0T10DRAFT_567301 [Thelonectria olida]